MIANLLLIPPVIVEKIITKNVSQVRTGNGSLTRKIARRYLNDDSANVSHF
jgi:hypothetical protein